MYEGHFHLHRRPFAATPDPGCCYLSPAQTPDIQSIARCIDLGQGLAIVTGPAGIGKTLLAQVLLDESESRFTGVYLGTGQFPTRRALLQTILYELGQPYAGMTDQELRLDLNTALRNLITQKDGLLLVLDEVHLLSDRLLEEVRLLADLAQHGVPLTRIVLCGNPEFEERLTSSALSAFNQRVACHVVLETLTRPESISYLEHRIHWAEGTVDRLFEREALQLIADASDGVPRCLNQLADHSLTQAFLIGETIVTAELVRHTLGELQHLPLRWNPSALHDRSARRNSTETTSHMPPESAQPMIADQLKTVGTVEQSESSTCCFEFGAGDGQADVQSTVIETVNRHTSVPMATPEIDEKASTVEYEAAESDDEEGPPLFRWLAGPPATNAAEHQPDDDYSTSSFTIHARQRQRAPMIEHEVVSTEPLSGPELLASHRREANRPSTVAKRNELRIETDLPAEELVFDQYANLDSLRTPMFPRPPVTFPTVSIPTRIKFAPIELQTTSASTNESARVLLEQATGPLERIDALCMLLDEADTSVQALGGVELITEFGVEMIDVDLPARSDSSTVALTEQLLNSHPESWIGSTVLEIGRDLQQAMAESDPTSVKSARASQIEELLDSIEREMEFDIVEPDREESRLRTDMAERPREIESPDDLPRVVPHPNHSYKNFFSVLRRRQSH